MANAIILAPLPIVGAAGTGASKGNPMYVGNDYAGVVWASAASAAPDLIIDLGADSTVDTIMLFGLVCDPAATLTINGATAAQGTGFAAGKYTASPAQSAFAGTQRLTTGAGVAFWQAPAGWPKVRYLALIFGLPSAGTVQISRVVAGARIQLARNFTFGAAIGVKDLGSLDFSRRGVLLRQRGSKLRTASLAFSNAYQDEVEKAIEPLIEQIGNTEMLALITNPAADPLRERRCYYGPLVGDLTNTWRTAAAWEWKANLVSLF